ncbi:MAG: HetZ-related protein [Oscillatoriales cyanobacterium RM1_1_9]|nr:HetZ-related protein [Oscillatoriales cyanobacterium SM2_3_0]NJO47387.1 HetZ-related protein [Oscillatoriales cyanobacterium RM2_1_1]NJO71354.1 HetZ-related protein [Oscillatoriales cyanobacterium RM1_1_9]
MLANINSFNSPAPCVCGTPSNSGPTGSATQKLDVQTVADLLLAELHEALGLKPSSGRNVMLRIALEVERICEKSQRIQVSGEERTWQMNLARHRLQKCLQYHKLGSQQGRVELHSSLAAMVYRHVAPLAAQLNFQGRYNLIEDFLQGFYIECLRAFRREHQLETDYTPRTRIELAEYMAFTEQYAKRQIGLPGRNRQRLIVLRAQGFAKGQPPETSVDIELAVEGAKTEEAEAQSRSHAMQQVREQMVAEAVDPAESVLRNRVIAELTEYLEAQGQTDCVEYLKFKLQDLQACDIDQAMGLSARERDYLQQRFKYHVEKFARNSNWQLVHEWLGAELNQKLGMDSLQWEKFQGELSPVQLKLLELKQAQQTDKAIAKALQCTPKQVQKQWTKLLDLAFAYRNAQA